MGPGAWRSRRQSTASATAGSRRAGCASTWPKRGRATTSSSACTAGRSTGTSGGTCCRRWPTAGTGRSRSTCAASAGRTRRATATRRRTSPTDVLAVLDELGLERVKLVGHDWGGWIGFLLCLRAPERFERYLALNILTPWVDLRADGAAALALLLPAAGRLAGARLPAPHQRQARAESPGRRLGRPRNLGRGDAAPPSPTTSPSPTAPAPACRCTGPSSCASSRRSSRGRYARAPPHRPDPASSSAPTTPPCAPKMLAGYQRHADDMRVELVEGCGHFIADEAPTWSPTARPRFFSAST